MPQLLTATEVAVLTGRPLRTVQRAAELGQLTYTQRLPGRTGAYLFTETAINEWLALDDPDTGDAA